MLLEEFGGLVVKATTAGGALPVKNAIVRIRGAGESNSDVEYSITTDIDGVTELLRLPAPPINLSLFPQPTERAYEVYDMEISADGYYTKNYSDIPVFEGVISEQRVTMIPKSEIYKNGVTVPYDNLNTIIVENENLN